MKQNSLTDIINGLPDIPDPERRDGEDYNWKRMTYDAEGIRKHHEARTKVADVRVSDDIPSGVRHYAESLEDTVEAWEYDDGSILLCAVCNEFAGTFANHKDNELHFFLLTPKKRRK